MKKFIGNRLINPLLLSRARAPSDTALRFLWETERADGVVNAGVLLIAWPRACGACVTTINAHTSAGYLGIYRKFKQPSRYLRADPALDFSILEALARTRSLARSRKRSDHERNTLAFGGVTERQFRKREKLGSKSRTTSCEFVSQTYLLTRTRTRTRMHARTFADPTPPRTRTYGSLNIPMT